MANLSGWHFVILLGVVVLLFGAKRLPEAARSVGQAARVLKGEMRGMNADEAGASSPTGPPTDPPAGLPAARVAEQPAPGRTQD